MWGISRVEHVYSAARSGFALVTVRFRVNESNEESLVKVYERLSAMGAAAARRTRSPPAVELHSIDDVPFLTLTLWSRAPPATSSARWPPSWPRSSPRSRRPARRT